MDGEIFITRPPEGRAKFPSSEMAIPDDEAFFASSSGMVIRMVARAPTRHPDPDPDGESTRPVIRMAIRMANWTANAIRMAGCMANYISTSADGDLHSPP